VREARGGGRGDETSVIATIFLEMVRIWGLRFRVRGLEFKNEGLGCKAQGSRLRG